MGTDVNAVQGCKNSNNNSTKKKQAMQTFFDYETAFTTSSDRHCWDLNKSAEGGNKEGGKVEDAGLYSLLAN